MKTIYVFPALVITAAIFSGACQKNEKSPDPKKGSAPSTSAAPEPVEKPDSKKDSAVIETKIDHATAIQASELMKKDPSIVVLDIRTPDEYATGHIPKSVNINFKADNFAEELKNLNPAKTYLVHCRSGGRSTSSLKTFSELKFHHIIHLDGGMMDWGKEQLPVEK